MMTTKVRYTFLLITALGLAACSSIGGFPERVVNAEDELDDLRIYFTTDEVTRYNNASGNQKQQVRNEIINGRLTAIDIQFFLFQQQLLKQGISLNIGTDAVTLGLGAAGALVSGGTSHILAAAAAALTGIKGSIDKNAFFEQTMPALFAQMIAQRKKTLVKIRTGLASDTTHYPLQQGFADLEDYQYAGSIPGSIATIVEDAGGTSSAATTELRDIVIRSNLDAPAQSIALGLGLTTLDAKGNNKFEATKEQKMRNCLLSAGVPKDTKLSIFMNDPKFATLRPQVNDCINQP